MRRRALFHKKSALSSGNYPSGLNNMYEFEENSSPFTDETGNFPLPATDVDFEAAGKTNFGVHFSGLTNQELSLGLIELGEKGASIVFWIKNDLHTQPSAVNTGLMHLNNSDFSSHYPYTNGQIYLDVLTSTRKTIGAGAISDRTNWHMFTVTADIENDIWKFYQNETLVHTSTVGSLTMIENGRIGDSRGNDTGTKYKLKATIDKLVIFTAPITQEDISFLYNSGNGRDLII